MKNHKILISLFCASIALVGSPAGAISFLPEHSVDSIMAQSIKSPKKFSFDFGLERAATIKSTALGGFFGPWGQHSFGISRNPQNDLILAHYNLEAGRLAGERVQVDLSLHAVRQSIDPCFTYQNSGWVLGITAPWRMVEHSMQVKFSAGNDDPGSQGMAKVMEEYFAGKFEDHDPGHLQSAMKSGLLVGGIQQVAGLSDLILMLGKKNEWLSDSVTWKSLGVFVRIPVGAERYNGLIFQPQLSRGGGAEVGVLAAIKLPDIAVGRSLYSQDLQGSIAVHAPYKKTLLPELRAGNFGYAALAGIEGMLGGPAPNPDYAQPLANLLTRQYTIAERLSMRLGYGGCLCYRGVEVDFFYGLRAEQQESVRQREAIENPRIGLIDPNFYGGMLVHQFGQDPGDFASQRGADWLGSKDLAYAPLRPACVGQEVSGSISKKIGQFQWKCGVLYLNYPQNRAFDGFSVQGSIGHDF